MKKTKLIGATILSVFVLSSTLDTVQIPLYNNISIVEAASIKLTQSTLNLKVNQTYSLKLSGTTKAVKWSSSKSSVASVSTSGKVTAKKKGTATITATVGSKKYNCKVTVTSVYADGTYTGTGTGFRNGTTKVSVTVKNDVITDINVTSNQDTPRFFTYASSNIISEILDTQSSNVDAVSGATYSSYGIINAVENALSKAKK